ncbi:MAG: thermonuclease family protein [Ilumatobacteraceae bacterium]|nr:nuclease [Actinomycetota bacterium]
MTLGKRATRYIAVLALALGSAACDSPPPPPPTHAVVIDTIDGDTLRADIAGVRETIRLIGVDTPETKHPTKRAQCYGPEATQFLAALLPPGTRVRIERDAEARDPYGRLLLYLFIARGNGEFLVSHALIAAGMARPLVIEPNVRYQTELVAAAFAAQRDARGLWGACR